MAVELPGPQKAFVLGLTGSIGMGKTEAAKNFAAEGAEIFDADAEVHGFYAPGGAAVAPVTALFGNVCTEDGGIDRRKLAAALTGAPEKLKALEGVVHPILVDRLEDFLACAHRAQTARTDGLRHIAILNIPLLFEAGLDRYTDAVAVVSAPEAVQQERVMARPDMNADKFRIVQNRQMPDAEKRRRADFVIDTGGSLDCSRQQVIRLMQQLRNTL